MKKVLFLMTVALVAMSCGSKKNAPVTPVAGEVEVTVPCSEYRTDATTMRATGSAISPNMQNAKDKALAAARRELSTSISARVDRVLEVYAASYDKDEVADFMGRTKDLSRQVSSQVLNGSVIACDKMTKSTDANGKVTYHSYIAVELASQELLENLKEKTQEAISKEDRLRTDFDYEQFKAVYEAEMKNFAK